LRFGLSLRRWSWFKPMRERFVLTDAQWAKMEPHCLGKKSDPGRSGRDNRLFVEAVLGIARTGSPWRDLPASFGKWNSVFRRYRDWVKADVFARLFAACSDEPDMSTPWSMPPSSRAVPGPDPLGANMVDDGQRCIVVVALW